MRSLLNLKFCFQSGFLTYTFSCTLAELKIYGECMGETLISDRIFGGITMISKFLLWHLGNRLFIFKVQR